MSGGDELPRNDETKFQTDKQRKKEPNVHLKH